jgi:hypothetical protein
LSSGAVARDATTGGGAAGSVDGAVAQPAASNAVASNAPMDRYTRNDMAFSLDGAD